MPRRLIEAGWSLLSLFTWLSARRTLIVGDCFVSAATCRDDLGMNSGDIPDLAINASSSYDFKSVGPLNSRSISACRVFPHFSLRVYCMVFERFFYPSFKVVCMVSIEPHFDSLFHRRRWKCETWKCGKENSAFKFELFEPLCKTNLNS